MFQKKPWLELTLQDDYMFKLVFGNKDFCKPMIEIILGIKIRDLVQVEREKFIQTEYIRRGIRLDIYAEDDKHTIHNVEMQVRNTSRQDMPETACELAKRTRYHQSLIDATLLKSGDRFWQLNQSFVIFICPFDLFDKNLSVYTFKSVCQEDSSVILDNGATVIFLNTKGDKSNLPPELKAFLEYMDHQEVSDDDDFVQRLAAEIHRLKQLKSEEENYMKYKVLDEDEYFEAKEEGLVEGMAKGKAEGKAEGLAEGMAKGKANALQQLMKNLGLTLEKAMFAIGIPLSELDFYRDLLAESE